MKSETSTTQRNQISPRITYSSSFFLFLIGSILGFVLEGLWRVIRFGHWENHSALVWGPFCIVYGFGALIVYLLSHPLREKGLAVQFIAFSIAGSAVEYGTSYLQELIFGSTSWDYSHHLFNIDGRISLQMAAIWGILGILFIKLLYPMLCRVMAKAQGKQPAIISFALSVFMLADFAVSGLAVLRWAERQNSAPPANGVEVWLDETYNDEKMSSIYCNMRFAEPRK